MRIGFINDTFFLTDGKGNGIYEPPEGFVSLEQTPLKKEGDRLIVDQQAIAQRQLAEKQAEAKEAIAKQTAKVKIDRQDIELTATAKEELCDNILLASASDRAEIEKEVTKLARFKTAQHQLAHLKQLAYQKIEAVEPANIDEIATITIPEFIETEIEADGDG